jgi:hypothetical protein
MKWAKFRVLYRGITGPPEITRQQRSTFPALPHSFISQNIYSHIYHEIWARAGENLGKPRHETYERCIVCYGLAVAGQSREWRRYYGRGYYFSRRKLFLSVEDGPGMWFRRSFDYRCWWKMNCCIFITGLAYDRWSDEKESLRNTFGDCRELIYQVLYYFCTGIPLECIGNEKTVENALPSRKVSSYPQFLVSPHIKLTTPTPPIQTQSPLA